MYSIALCILHELCCNTNQTGLRHKELFSSLFQYQLQTVHLRDGMCLLRKQPEAITILMTPGYGGGSHSLGPPTHFRRKLRQR